MSKKDLRRDFGVRVRFAAFAAGLGLLGAAFAGVNAGAAKPALSSSFSLERPVIVRGGTHPVYVLVHFTAPDLDIKPAQRAALEPVSGARPLRLSWKTRARSNICGRPQS